MRVTKTVATSNRSSHMRTICERDTGETFGSSYLTAEDISSPRNLLKVELEHCQIHCP